jgi:hypothetical protein
MLFCASAFSVPLYSPTWGFRVDLPSDYEFAGGDGKDRFSFENPGGAKFDIIAYHAGAPYASVEALARDTGRRLNNKGDIDFFEYRGKKACVMELSFSMPAPISGWALCMELGASPGVLGSPLLLAMAYGPEGNELLQILHFSVLDSLAPEEGDILFPGPITEYLYPRETRVQVPIFGLDISALVYDEDAEAAQALIDREFQVLRLYADSRDWEEAWRRFYRAIYRDSFDRLTDAAFQIERKLNVPPRENRDFAGELLRWVQSFTYERDFFGSDFINLVSACTGGRGDCDNRSMLWALILKQAGVPSAMMVSRFYSHAMGLADLPGSGARFELEGTELLVAETTAGVSIGLIGEGVSGIGYWLGIAFE